MGGGDHPSDLTCLHGLGWGTADGFESGPTESSEDVEMDPDEDLPWSNPELIHAWWEKNKSRFRSGIRFQPAVDARDEMTADPLADLLQQNSLARN
jgi:hypothetical protein